MAKELYLFSSIYDWSAEMVSSQIHENMGKATTLRALSCGGSVFAAYTIYQKIKEHGNINLKADGALMSAAAFIPLYCKSSECLNVSRFVFHRADMFVNDEKSQKFLNDINADIKAIMLQKINPEKWKAITGQTIEDMFNPETRIDIILTGTQAVEVGLVDKLVMLTPQMQSEITALNNNFFQVAASSSNESEQNPLNKPIMTIEQLKAEKPALYKEVIAVGKKLGAKAEKQRIDAWMKFVTVDPKAVEAGIAGGEVMSQAEMIDFLQKQQSPDALAAIKKDNPANVSTEQPKPEMTQMEKEIADFKAGVLANTTTLKPEAKV